MTMDIFKNIGLGIAHGMWDSIRGMTLLLHIDDEIHRLNVEKIEERQQRYRQRQRRSPSPTPSSASAMERQEQEDVETTRAIKTHEHADERHIQTVLNSRARAAETEPEIPKPEKKIAKQVLKCCLLNGGFTWASILIFEQVILPTLRLLLTLFYGQNSSELHVLWGWLQSILSIIFGIMWVLPIFLLSKVVSSLWFADIANAAYRVRKGRPQMIPSISKLIADFLFSLLVQALFLVQSILINCLPIRYMGQSLCFLHLCLLYSLYSFEYKWFNMGWELHRRLSYIENNWPYFLGFGIPLTVLTNLSNSIIASSCIFSIFFPLFILSGNEAKPLIGTTDTPLRLFSPVVFFSNLFFRRPADREPTASQNATYDAQQLLLQKQQQHQRMLQQQLIEHEYRQRNMRREHRARQQFRYQQPPPLNSSPSASSNSSVGGSVKPRHKTPERSVSRHRRRGGMRPLIPTPAPAASTAVRQSQ